MCLPNLWSRSSSEQFGSFFRDGSYQAADGNFILMVLHLPLTCEGCDTTIYCLIITIEVWATSLLSSKCYLTWGLFRKCGHGHYDQRQQRTGNTLMTALGKVSDWSLAHNLNSRRIKNSISHLQCFIFIYAQREFFLLMQGHSPWPSMGSRFTLLKVALQVMSPNAH